MPGFDPTSAKPIAFDPSTAVLHNDGQSLGDVASNAAHNLLPSAGNLATSLYQAVRHPLDTAGNLVDVAGGELQKISPTSIQNIFRAANPAAYDRANAAATGVNNFYGNRYGSVEGFKNAVGSDPVGVLADASVLAGGAGAVAKAGDMSRAAALGEKIGSVANPISLAVKPIPTAARGLGDLLSEGLGATTGTSGPTIRTAFGAGLDGGDAADALRAHMSGNAPIEDIVTDARNAVGNLRAQRGADYRGAMGAVNSDPTVLSLDPIDEAVAKSNSINNFKGIDLSPSTAAVRQKISDTLDLWKQQDPAEFHTAAGFDALKKSIGDIRDSAPFGTPERAIADQTYNAVKNEVASQAPTYAGTMADYAKASDQINDIQKTLSLGPNASVDTGVRKLQSALRDNVNTSYGRRADLAQVLTDNGAPNLMEKIAGQQLNSGTSRGIGKMLAQGEIMGAPAAYHYGGLPAVAADLGGLMLSSPRLVGEATFAAGKGARLAKALASQIGPQNKTALIASELGKQNNPPNAAALGALLAGG